MIIPIRIKKIFKSKMINTVKKALKLKIKQKMLMDLKKLLLALK